jgi:hypothetical protein
MTDDIKQIIRRLGAMSTRADALARALDHHRRTGNLTAQDDATLHRVAVSAREFNQRVELAVAALPARFNK